MKRLLVLMLVLGMASFANAALLISVDGVVDPPETSIVLSPSDTVVIDIWGDGQSPALGTAMYLASSEWATSTILDGTDLVLLYGNLSNWYQVDNSQGELDYVSFLLGDVPVCSAIFIGLNSSDIPTPPLDGVLVDGIVLHCASYAGDAVLYLVEAQGAEIFDTQVIHIPEPASMLLLGLGGLALLRKKRCSRL